MYILWLQLSKIMEEIPVIIFFLYALLILSFNAFIQHKFSKRPLVMTILMTSIIIISMGIFGWTIAEPGNRPYEFFNSNLNYSPYIYNDTIPDNLSNTEKPYYEQKQIAPNSIITYQANTFGDQYWNDDNIRNLAQNNVNSILQQGLVPTYYKANSAVNNYNSEGSNAGENNPENPENPQNPQNVNFSLTKNDTENTEQDPNLVTNDIRQILINQNDIDQIKENIANDPEAQKIIETQTKLYTAFGVSPDEIDSKIDELKQQMYDEEIELLKQTRYDELVEDEFQQLKYEQYYLAQEKLSKNLLQLEQENPYNILPKDMWYKPDESAKDIINSTPCQCPSEIKWTGINYSTFNE